MSQTISTVQGRDGLEELERGRQLTRDFEREVRKKLAKTCM